MTVAADRPDGEVPTVALPPRFRRRPRAVLAGALEDVSPRRFLWIALGLFILLSLVIYWPQWPGATHSIVGCPCGDSMQEVWFLKWTPWAIAHGRFRKILRADARSPARFRALYDAYARLAELAVDAVATPALRAVALGVRLLFGAHEVLIDMAALSGARDAEDAEVTGAGSVLDAAAAGVAWLASRRLLYVDLRGPNVLVAGREVWLVDFDDCIVLPAPVCDVGAFRYALSKTDAAAMGDWASEFVRGALPEVDVALARAFAALEP